MGRRPLPGASLATIAVSVLAALLLVASVTFPAPREDPPTGPPLVIPPATRPSAPPVDPAPEWTPLLDPDDGRDSWPGWDAFVTGPEYLRDLSVPYETAHFLDNMTGAFPWTDEAWSLLRKNGFVVFDGPEQEDIEKVYLYYWHQDLPVFITTDTILHVHHLLFDQMVQDLEVQTLLPILENMSVALLGEAAWLRYTLPESLRGPATEAVVFFAVPNLLLGTGAEIPSDIEAKAGEIARKIEEARLMELAHIRDGVEEYIDWTQYKPRGHYDRSDALRRYFRAMMWLGRASYDVENATDLVPASIIAATADASARGGGLWTRIYNATARLVGESDSLNHYDLRRAFLRVFGTFNASLLADPANVERLRTELASDAYYRQRILSTIIVTYDPRFPGEPALTFPKIYQFMGQRYVLDSETMQGVMYDRVPIFQDRRRGLPNGLDVVAALGSSRATDLLRGEITYYGYETQLRQQWSAVSNKSEAFWNRTSYSRHLSAVREVVGPPPVGAPAFMRTPAWAAEKANTGLGSWAELRHDTILYAKQPYSVAASCSTPGGWVEPYPAFFWRMAWLSDQIRWILETHFDGGTDVVRRFLPVWRQFASINARLATIAQSELDGRALSQEDVEFIRSIFVWSWSDYTGEIRNFGWLPEILRNATITEQTRDPRIIADVATDPESPASVLHVAVGRFRHAVVAYETPDGAWHLAAGPVFRYFEFAVEGFTRLTDGEWKAMLDSDPPASPAWASEFLAP